MKRLMLALTLALAVQSANALTLEPVQEIPNIYGTLNWNEHSLLDLKHATKGKQNLNNICDYLKDELSDQAYETCELARESLSATQRVRLYLQAAHIDDNKDLANYAVWYARQRMTEPLLVKLVSEVELLSK